MLSPGRSAAAGETISLIIWAQGLLGPHDGHGMDKSGHIVVHIPRLRRYARALVGERGAADDLVQDTLERALTKFHLWRPGTDLRAWLFTIMHNVHVNQVRSRREYAVLDDEVADLPVSPAQESALQGRDLERAVAQLPIEQREVLLLVALEDMSYDEVARTVGIPIGTVMSRLSRAREKLRAWMDGGAAPSRLHRVK